MVKTSAEKLWLTVALLVAVVLVLVGYFFLIGPQRSSTDDVDAQVTNTQFENDSLQARITALDAQNHKLSSYQAAVRRAELALPTTSGLPDFLRSLQSLGGATLADVTSLTVGSPNQVDANGAPAAAAATTAAPATGGTSAPSTTTSTAPSGPQLFALPITAEITGTLPQLTAFLGQLQSVQPRAVLVNSVTVAGPGTGAASGVTTMDVSMQAFVAPGSLAETQQLAQAASK